MTSNTVVVVTASMISFPPDRKQTLLQNLCQSNHSCNLVAVAVLPMSTLVHRSFAQFVLALCVLYVLWMCFCAHTSTCGFAPRDTGMLVCILPQSKDLLVQPANLLTCGTIYLTSLIWFDCIPPASVAANSPQCDSVVWHKVMKTHKALITCQ